MDISLSDIAWVGGGLLALTIVSLLFTYRAEIAQAAGPVMSPPSPRAPRETPDMDAVYIPVSQTSMDDDDDLMPRIGRALTDAEIVILLGVQRRGGKYRFSANQIQALVGGDRNTVMRQIRELREGMSTAEYRPLTPEQAASRASLGLLDR